jgi:hypothetical protein
VTRAVLEVQKILQKPEPRRTGIANLDAESDKVVRSQIRVEVHRQQAAAFAAIGGHREAVG